MWYYLERTIYFMEDQQQPVVRRVRRRVVKAADAMPAEMPEVPQAPPEPQPTAEPMTHVALGATSRRAISAGALAVALTIVAVFGVKAFLPSSFAAKPTAAQSPSAVQQDVASLIKAVSKHILIKTGETPAVATVMDPDALRQQNPTFYQDAQKGDRLLVWSDKAVLYSPSRDILLFVMPLNGQGAQSVVAPQTNTTAPSTNGAEQASIEIRNGSGVAGLGKKLATALQAAGLTTLAPGDAKATTPYPNTLIVNVSGKPLPKTLAALQQATGGQLANLPGAEGKAKGDVLVIIGADYTSK